MDEKEYINYLQQQMKTCMEATKDKEWALALFEKTASPRYYWIMDQEQKLQKKVDQVGEPTTQPRDATDKMKRTIWGLIYGDKGDPKLESELTTHDAELNRFTITKKYIDWKWANEFIDKYKKIVDYQQ